MPRYVTHSEDETLAVAGQIASLLPPRGLVLLTGNLGAGKTTLAKGIIAALGLAAPADVTSPTYTIVHEYGEPVRIFHIDLYRLETADEVRALGFDELLESNALLLIEWGERFPELLPLERIEIYLSPGPEEDQRTIEVQGL